MTIDEFDRVVSMMADGLGLVVGAPLEIGRPASPHGTPIKGTYERSVMLGDPIRIVAVTVRRADGGVTSVPWEQIAYITVLPSDGSAQ